MTARTATQGNGARLFETVVSVYGAAVFATLWIGLAVALATGGTLLEDAWAWLSALQPLAAVIVWLLILPIGVGLWAWNTDPGLIVELAAAAGLIAWTAVAASGLRKVWRRGN